jgi:hypothetical protein
MKFFSQALVIKKLKRTIKQFGWIDSIFYVLNHLASIVKIDLFFNKYYFAVQPLNADPTLPSEKGKRLRVEWLLPSSIKSNPCPRPYHVMQDRYCQGSECLAIFKEDVFAGCLWYIKYHYKEDEVRCLYELPEDIAVWDFDVYVDPKFRLSPVFLKLWDAASAKLVNEGVRWSFSRISAFNAMSLSSHKRMGAKIVGWSVFVRMSSLQLTISSLKPYFHLSFSDASYPIFKFDLPKV